MPEDKYYYNGIPLSTYCKDNGINTDTVRTRIWKKKHNKKYADYTDQEIVDMVIETSGTGIKYMYKGTTLRKYCLENGLSPSTIAQRVINLKKENPELSNDELVVLAIEEFENKNYKYFYKGMPLKEYCKSHPEINYNNIRGYILEKRKKQPNLSIDEIIEQYINGEKDNIKYYYQGTTLRQYCEENDINYNVILGNMKRNRNAEGYKDLSDEEFIERIINQYEPKEGKYFYKGMSLYEYCKQNDISYYSVVSFVKRSKERGSKKTTDELIDEGIKTINRHQIKYYYQGIPLIEYAKENGLNANSIRGAILRKKTKSDEPLQEIVDYYVENPPIATRYYYKDQSLKRFCDENGYPYQAIQYRIRRLKKKDGSLDSEQIIEQAINQYEKKLEIDTVNEIFNKLRSPKVKTINEIIDICKKLKIDFENVNDLVEKGFRYNQAITMIWYYSNKKTSDGLKMITDDKIEEIFSIIESLISEDRNIGDFKTYDLIAIYKCELYDTRNELIEREKPYIKRIIYTLCTEYGIRYTKSNYEEFENEIKYYLLVLVSRTNMNNEGQIVRYLDLTVKGYFRTYLKKYKEEAQNYSLDDAMYQSEKGTRGEKARIDYIADQNNSNKKKQSSLSSNMMRVLSTLPPEDLTLIMLKYQEDYTEEELSNYFSLTPEEIREKENQILSLLKTNKSVKKLKKNS